MVKYIESIKNKLSNKYESFYLIRNEKDVRIYSFNGGNAFEPDFVLILKHKKSNNIFDNFQIFIEPKGAHLRKEDKWKEDFLLELKQKAKVKWITQTDSFNVWGMPFFTENENEYFQESFKNDDVKPKSDIRPKQGQELL
ncbi:MAG: hypothetical protein ACI4V5_06840 [Prevotella sp.]